MKRSELDHLLKIRIPLVLFVALATAIATYYVSRAERDGVGYAPRQPIAFSHKLHAGTMQINCQYCHSSVGRSPHANVPAVSICMNCHTIAKKNSPEIIKLTKYYQEGVALPWKRIHKIPDFAYFNHSVHVNRGILCAYCHGDVQSMDVVRQVNQFTMAACLHCHRDATEVLAEVPGITRGPDNCATCHR